MNLSSIISTACALYMGKKLPEGYKLEFINDGTFSSPVSLTVLHHIESDVVLVQTLRNMAHGSPGGTALYQIIVGGDIWDCDTNNMPTGLEALIEKTFSGLSQDKPDTAVQVTEVV